MTTSTVTPEIVDFAQGVRAALADLPAEEVDDLTEGLEADLAESLAEDLRRTLPDPVAYAAELRAAAGLPARAPTVKRGLLSGVVGGWRDTRKDIASTIRRNPALAPVLDFLDAVRPLWWALRAWLATWIVAAFFGHEDGYWFGSGWWLVLVAFVVISVQWGRGEWHFTGLRGLIVVGNVIAVVALPAVLNAPYVRQETLTPAELSSIAPQGLSMDGLPLENIYVYDADGKPLDNVQLFDVDGKPLEPNRDTGQTSILQRPATLETGVEAYNVYPLDVVKAVYDDNGELVPDPNPDPDKAAAYKNGPFLKVPAVDLPEKVAKSNE